MLRRHQMEKYLDVYLKFIDSSVSEDATREHLLWAALNTIMNCLEAYDSVLAEKVLLRSLEIKIKTHNLINEMGQDYAATDYRVA
jgi:hypothetical protein